ncbi:uncharacterized protein LOC118348955 [Juglans regia]|uniref:Uncharacterized protein LOC118348955 n=1 Tax=Juglans regia TaxID=51240 RepID=A0A6P9EJ90_JUGRE|nr:uncharacterized protein LOC118348955 [Juglans regia]
MDDIPTCYHLQNGDSLGTILVSNILTGDNYHTWSRSMVMAFKAKNKIGFVDGSIRQPIFTDNTYELWERCNNMVSSWLINSVSKEIGCSIICAKSARDMWLDLKNRFTQGNGPRIYQLQKDLSVLMQADLSVRDYYTRFKSLWDELLDYNQVPSCSCGALQKCNCGAIKIFLGYQDRQHVMQFLMGLNDSFSHIRGQILMLDPLPEINKVFSLVVQEEKQREISKNGIVDTVAFMSKVQDSNTEMRKFNSGKQQTRREKLYCTHCGMNNHTMDKCYKIHGYPPGFKQNFTNSR